MLSKENYPGPDLILLNRSGLDKNENENVRKDIIDFN